STHVIVHEFLHFLLVELLDLHHHLVPFARLDKFEAFHDELLQFLVLLIRQLLHQRSRARFCNGSHGETHDEERREKDEE
ncbi:hypothetical protein PMAYCL1PPCAC_12883, partial [Pristionchus mayeri]